MIPTFVGVIFFYIADTTGAIFETIIARVAAKLQQMKINELFQVNNSTELHALFQKVQSSLNDLKAIIKDGYRQMASSHDLHEKGLARKFCETEGAVSSFLMKMDLISNNLLRVKTSSFQDVYSYFKNFFTVLNLLPIENKEEKLLTEIKCVFTMKAREFPSFIISHFASN